MRIAGAWYAAAVRVLTVGHSTRSAREFLELLAGAGVVRLVDVRRFPASRRHPHFAASALRRLLEPARIAYAHEPRLGGRRRARPDSPNTAWRTNGFRGYADHMATAEFHDAVESLREGDCLMCAEAIPWRCHRQLIADALVLRGHEVVHLLGRGVARPHRLHSCARLEGGVVLYRAPVV